MKEPCFITSPFRRLLVFVAGAAVSVALGISVGTRVSDLLGVSRPFVTMALASSAIAGLLLVLSAFLLQREGTTAATLGLPTNSHRMREMALGFILSAVLFQTIAYAQTARVGASWHFQGWPGVSATITGLGLTACMVLAEELLFRGIALRYLRALSGDWPVILLSALLFGAYHVIGSHNWGMGLVLQFFLPALGGLLFGWAAVRSGGLALPIGLHWGGNWIQASVAGFSSLAQPPQALWQIPITAADFKILTAPDLLSHLPYLAAIMVSMGITGYLLRAIKKIPRHPPRTG
jgi:uncharacterized protein